MNRKVVIIKGFSTSDAELDTDRYYAKQYFNFFVSNSGGAYFEEEILYLEDITTKEFHELENLQNFDYLIFVLIGHGATQNNNQLFQLNENEIIKAGQFETNTKKNLFILEICRTKTDNVYTVDLTQKIPKFEQGGILRKPIGREKARQIYNELINRSIIIICYACSKNEVAINYYFSFWLIQIAFDWHLENKSNIKVLTISELMSSVSKEVRDFTFKNTGISQNPQVVGNTDFPFSISKF